MTFSCLFLNNLPEFLQKELCRTCKLPIFRFLIGGFLHFVPAKLHFVKKTFRLIENLLCYKHSRQRGRHGQHRRVTASIPAGELQDHSFHNMKNNSS